MTFVFLNVTLHSCIWYSLSQFHSLRKSWLVWHSGSAHHYTTSSPVSTGIGDNFWLVHHPGIYPRHSGPLSLAILPWVGAVSTGYGFGRLW